MLAAAGYHHLTRIDAARRDIVQKWNQYTAVKLTAEELKARNIDDYQLYYAIQTLRRTAPTTGWRAGVHAWLRGDGVARGRASLQRWGLVMVPLAYLTIGFQTFAGLVIPPCAR